METKLTQGCTGLYRVVEAANKTFLPLPEAHTGRRKDGSPGRPVRIPHPRMAGGLFHVRQALVQMPPIDPRTLMF